MAPEAPNGGGRPFRLGRSATPAEGLLVLGGLMLIVSTWFTLSNGSSNREAIRRDREVMAQRTRQLTKGDSQVYMIASGQEAHLVVVEAERWNADGYARIGAEIAAFGLACVVFAIGQMRRKRAAVNVGS